MNVIVKRRTYMKKILLINDLPGYGHVALSAMTPVLEAMELETFNLPTAVVSNTLDWGKFSILATDEQIVKTIAVWDELGFEFDAVATGFIANENQAEIIADYCVRQSRKGVKIFADPIMGDEGKLYNSITEKRIAAMKKLVSVADYIVPNYTEAAALADRDYIHGAVSKEEMCAVAKKLNEMGAKNVVITSANVEGSACTMGYDGEKGEFFFIPYEIIKGRFIGTGDIFSAFMAGYILRGERMQTAVKKAMDAVKILIMHNLDNTDVNRGLIITKYLGEILNGRQT